MNYVCVFIVAVALFAIIYWYAAGRFYYVGPRVKAQLVVGVEGEDDKPFTRSSSDGNRPGELDAHEQSSESSGQDRATEINGQSEK